MSTAPILNIIILAAGQGTRMKSAIPKVLHPLAGKPMLMHVIDAARRLNPARIIVVYGHGGEQVPAALASDDLTWVEQAEQLGTGHAVEQAMPNVDPDSTVLVLYGDVPMVRTDTLAELVRLGNEGFGLLTVHLADPVGYGRIVRNEHGAVTAIVEEKDASESERQITEINTGMLATPAGHLHQWLGKLENKNAQQEYYLTDTIAMAVVDGIRVQTTHPDNEYEVAGVNSRAQLMVLERNYQLNQANRLMAAGVTVLDPSRLDVRGEVSCGQDVTIDINVVLSGKVGIGSNVRIGPGCVISDSIIADDVEIKAMCVIEQSRIGRGAIIGPYARLRPGTELSAQSHVGNFVEIKNSQIGEGSKINHLSYIGDTTMGAKVNVGAGTITCNYDGANKHRTIIGDRVFIGSDSQLVAPITVGDDATLGAGTTLTADAPEGELTLSRVKQKSIKNWIRPKKEK
ncbi:MAG: bifunctional UDP-N-acetylglucosamine diphosphorylase/glucosamine-1-phosphate N-acetyltransferase GlmU [Proteobacteria bacterium]|nr:bifunctional UDP-N-acetylglucosamine diphosphorylase/glucosamine-1-phosphate N-acetyltransferase GlmU [Pseudomonadota bacterium]